MLVYADSTRRADPRELLRAIWDRASILQRAPRSERDEHLTALLIDAGELAQGLVDSDFELRAVDDLTPLVEAATALAREVAACFVAAHDEDYWIIAPDRLSPSTMPALPEHVTVSLPEGFAFYAVYPQAWIQPAELFRGARTRVIGIRSIGLTLGAVVAAAAGAERFVSVRPTGHPFDRVLAVGSKLERSLLEDNADVTYLVVDEGPGLSGSSFASVAKWLVERGVSHDRVVFIPSHAGEPGPRASEGVRRIWASTRRIVPEAPRVLDTFAGAEELGGGEWRRKVYGEHRWPPANPRQERRKLLVQAHGAPLLAKFAGLGRYGADKLALAEALAASRWTPRPRGFASGFITSDWLPDALPLDHPAARLDRAGLVGRLIEYIVFRGAELPASDCAGASIEALFSVLLTNVEEAIGAGARARFSAWERRLDDIADGLEPCRTDNRMHRWEWLVDPSGTIVKCDAVDHHAAHDLVGVQDPLWDVVGARYELGLDDAELSALRHAVARQLGRWWTDAQVEFFSAAYLAFQCGAASLAAETASDADAALLRGEARRYAFALTMIAPSVR